MLTQINEFLARVHYLNHPWISVIGAVVLLLMGSYVLFKNPKSELYRVFFLWNFTLFLWFLGNAISMWNFRNFEFAVFIFRPSYTAVTFLAALSYHFYAAQFKKDNKILYSLYLVGLLEVIYLWFSDDIKTGAQVLFNVGVFWVGMPRFSYFLTFGMVKYTVTAFVTAMLFMKESKRAVTPFKKNQLKSLAIFLFAFSFGWSEWLVTFGVPLHIAWVVIPFFMGTIGYSIIHYRAMEIDTVVHRTILWVATIMLLVLPAGILGLILINIAPSGYVAVKLAVLSLYLVLFVVYYTRLRPHIDNLFRRRKYDYQTILGKIAEKIATTINIENLTRQLLNEISETIYLRNSMLYVAAKEGEKYVLIGRRGYKEKDGLRQRSAVEIYSNEKERSSLALRGEVTCKDNPFCAWVVGHQDIVEKGQVELNPAYEPIKGAALDWFRENDVELIVPLTLENKVNGILGLGRKENLQFYTAKDVELLKKMGQEVGVTVFNALHYEDLAEKERLDEEMKMGRQIQMALLPQRAPQIEGLNVQGLMQPAKEIGGDYYDFITLGGPDKLGIVIGDVSGKGVAAGLLMSMVKATIHSLSQEGITPKRLLLRTNQLLYQNIGGQKFMTLLYFLWDNQSRSLTYSSAGHEHILIYRNQSKRIEVIQSGGFMLGMVPDIDTFLEEKKIQLQQGDKILLYTDGVTEAQDKSDDRFGLERLKDTLLMHSQKPANEFMQSIKDEVYAFIGDHPQYDDITLVVLEAQ